MHFIDKVNLEPPSTWSILDVVEKLSCVFNFSTRRCIHFDKIDETTLVDLSARAAFFAGDRANPLFAI